MDSTFHRPAHRSAAHRPAAHRSAALAGLLCVLGAAAARLDAQPAPLPIDVAAESMTLDRGANTYSFRGLLIERDEYTIEARRAVTRGLEPDAEASEWRFDFEGSVRVQVGSAVLRAGQARFRFAGRELLHGDLSGEPAEFEDLMPEGEAPVRGTANRIAYDQRAGQVRMEGNVAFTLGPNHIEDCDLTYDLNEESVDSGPDNGEDSGADNDEPCMITYVPPAERDDSDDEPAARP